MKRSKRRIGTVLWILFLCAAAAAAAAAVLVLRAAPAEDLGAWRMISERRLIGTGRRQAAKMLAAAAAGVIGLSAADRCVAWAGGKISGRFRSRLTALSRMLTAAVLCAVLLPFLQQAFRLVTEEQRVMEMRRFLQEERYIIHACGFIEDPATGEVWDYTNSLEALENAVERGNRLIEIDFMRTSDGHMVCAHDSVDGIWAIRLGFMQQPDLETFLTARFAGVFHVMDLEDLAAYMRSHRDFYVMTDVKMGTETACGIIRDVCPDLTDRFIIQIYHEEEYAPVRALGFNYIVFTMYLTHYTERKESVLQEMIRRDDLVALSHWASRMDDDDYLAKLLRTGLPICAHTVNGAEQQKYFDKGIAALYTDDVEH